MCLNALIPNFEAYVLLTTAGDVYNLPTVKGQEGSELHSDETGGLAMLTSVFLPPRLAQARGSHSQVNSETEIKAPFYF